MRRGTRATCPTHFRPRISCERSPAAASARPGDTPAFAKKTSPMNVPGFTFNVNQARLRAVGSTTAYLPLGRNEIMQLPDHVLPRLALFDVSVYGID